MTTPVFANSNPTLSPGVTTVCNERGTIQTYAKNEFIYLPCDQPCRAFIVEQGLIRIGISTEEGEELTTAVLKTGDFFGHLAGHHPHQELAQALTAVRVRTLDSATLYRRLSSHPAFAREFLGMLERRFQQLEQHFAMMNTQQARERLIAFLRFLAEHHGRRRGDTLVVDNFLTHNDLARIINATRQTISSCLTFLEETGELRYSRQQIVLLPAFPGLSLIGKKVAV